MVITARKTISSVVNSSLVSQETFVALTPLESVAMPTFGVAPLVFVDNDTNRRLRPDNITLTGFDIYGDPVGDDPPYNLQIWIIPSSVLSTGSGQLGDIKKLIRNTIYMLPTGRRWNLWGKEGIEFMPDPILVELINKSIRDVNMDILEDAEVYRTTLSTTVDYITLPSQIILIKEVVVFASATEKRGTPLEGCASYESLVESGYGLTGTPERYLPQKKTINSSLTRFLQFNRTPDAALPIEVHYWKLTDAVASDTDIPEIFSGYHELIETRAKYKVAGMIGDFDRKREFFADYDEQRERAIKLQTKFNAPIERVRYALF